MQSLRYSIVVKGSPFATQAVNTAYLFTKTLCELKIGVVMVFFMGDGVLIANPHNTIASDEHNLAQRWIELAKAYHFPLALCDTACSMRGIETVDEHFERSGLGALAHAMLSSQRLISF